MGTKTIQTLDDSYDDLNAKIDSMDIGEKFKWKAPQCSRKRDRDHPDRMSVQIPLAETTWRVPPPKPQTERANVHGREPTAEEPRHSTEMLTGTHLQHLVSL